jgi:hypothetical protein
VKDGNNTPMNALFSTTKLALTVLGDQPTLPRIVWQSSDFESLNIDGRNVELAGLRRLVEACLTKCKERLDVVLCGIPVPRGLLGKDVYDSHTNVSYGYSFLNDPRNRIGRFKPYLANHLLNSRTLFKR